MGWRPLFVVLVMNRTRSEREIVPAPPVEDDTWQRTEIEKGIAEVEAGDVITGAEMTAWITNLRKRQKP